MWATWCGPCRTEIPELTKMRRAYDAKDLAIIGISDESAATVRKFVADNGVNYPMVSASNLPAPFGDVNALPTKFMIDSDGVIRRILVGAGGGQALHDLVASVH
jgi:peroxiredoxin